MAIQLDCRLRAERARWGEKDPEEMWAGKRRWNFLHFIAERGLGDYLVLWFLPFWSLVPKAYLRSVTVAHHEGPSEPLNHIPPPRQTYQNLREEAEDSDV